MTSYKFPKPFVVEPTARHELTVILIHGRGSTSEEFAEDFFSTGLRSLRDRFSAVRWVFPTARRCLSTVYQEEIPEWYDVWSLVNPDERPDLQKPGLAKSIEYIVDIIQSERDFLKRRETHTSRRNALVLGGISMGCAVGIHALLHLAAANEDHDIDGFFGWCGWLPFASSLRERQTEALERGDKIQETLREFYADELGVAYHAPGNLIARELKIDNSSKELLASVLIFLSHCNDDSIIDIRLGRELRDSLESLGTISEWQEYADGGHWIKDPEAVNDFASFIQQIQRLGQQQS
jgi:lysophospholipase II